MTIPNVLRVFMVALAALLLIACPSGADEAPGAGSGASIEPPPTEAPEPEAEASGDPAPEATGPDDTAGDAGGEPEPVEPEAEPIELTELMAAIGYADASEIDIAEFVHVPPGAHAQAGRFGDGSREVRVALVTYANERYARPHVTDVRERIRVVPSATEAVAGQGPVVLHIRAIDRATADEVRSLAIAHLGWEDDAGSGEAP